MASPCVRAVDKPQAPLRATVSTVQPSSGYPVSASAGDDATVNKVAQPATHARNARVPPMASGRLMCSGGHVLIEVDLAARIGCDRGADGGHLPHR